MHSPPHFRNTVETHLGVVFERNGRTLVVAHALTTKSAYILCATIIELGCRKSLALFEFTITRGRQRDRFFPIFSSRAGLFAGAVQFLGNSKTDSREP